MIFTITKSVSVIIDRADYATVLAHRWAYRRSERGYTYAFSPEVGLMHRWLMKCPADKVVDHINGDTLDNRRGNLRVCTIAENNRNHRLYKSNSTGYNGVTFDKRQGQFRAAIQVDGQFVHLGYYDDSQEAAKIYDKHAKEVYGEFARLNFTK